MITIDQAVQDFFIHCRYEKNLSVKTLRAYGTDLSQFAGFLVETAGARKVDQVDKHHLRAFLKTIMTTAKPKTTKRKMATLRAFFNFLEFEDHITVSPFRKMRIKISQEVRLPVVMTLLEVKQLFLYMYNRRDQPHRSPFSRKILIRDIAILEMLFATGMRVSELCYIRNENLDLETGTVRILGKGRRERQIPLCEPNVLHSLEHYKQVFSNQIRFADHLFLTHRGAQITEQSVRVLVEKHTAAAGLAKKITPHTFRHYSESRTITR